MIKTKRIWAFFAAAFLAATAWAIPVSAASPVDAGFSVNAVIPENQIDKSKTYFDLRMEPGQKQDLELEVVNPNSWDITVTLEAISASTNLNGIINYTTESELRDESLKVAFADIATPSDEQIVVPAHAAAKVAVTVSMPEQPYDGMILGSVRMVKLPTDEEKNSGAMIINQYSYVTGVRLRVTDTPVAPDYALGEVQTELVNYRAAVTAQIRNPVAEIAKGITVDGKLYQKGGSEPLVERTQTDVEMAPNSIYPFAFVDEAGYGFEPGDYFATFTLEHEGKIWSFEREFSIAAEQAQEVNANALNQHQNAPTAVHNRTVPSWVWVLLAVIVLLVISMVLILLRIRKGNREYQEYMLKMQNR